MVDKETKRREAREALARGERPVDDDDDGKPYGEDDVGLQGGIIIPLAPFGIPKYDNGERFDLKARPLPFLCPLREIRSPICCDANDTATPMAMPRV